jgi:4-amino-4-deoxy-L-arabinose transferase-like glycosyltransferase
LARGVWLVAAFLVLGLLVVASRYGWHRDELYFLEAGRHLAWGYVDQPPLTPLLARVADLVASGNLVVLRVFPAFAAAGAVVVGALTVREMGGHARSQLAGAGTVAAGGYLLGVGHLLSTASLDFLAWMVLLWVTARMLRVSDPRWWMLFGVVSGAALLNKSLVVLLVVSILIGLAVVRRSDLLVTPWLLLGAVLATAVAAPNLYWQASHGWPQLEMSQAIARQTGTGNRFLLIPLQVVFVGPAFLGLMRRGVGWMRRGGGQTYRVLLWAWMVGMSLTLLTGGRPYYPVPLTVMAVLAGVVAYQDSGNDPRRLRKPILINAVFSALIALPVLPVTFANLPSTVNETLAETIGWPELAHQVADLVDSLPDTERKSVVILTSSYGEAGAIDLFGPKHGLPPAYSAHNSYADFRQPENESAATLAIGYRVATLESHFRSCEQVGEVDNGYGIDNEAQGKPLVVCHGLISDWDETWPELRHLD